MRHVIHVPIYHTAITVSNDYKEQPVPNTNNDGGQVIAAVWHEDGEVFMTYNPEKITRGVLAHECLHIANHICEMKFIKADVTNDEHVAYLLEWAFDELYAIIFGGEK
jgi:hypothetical protein